MEYLVSDIVKDAKVCLDENVSSDPLLSLDDLDTLTLEEIIASKVEDAARLVESSASRELLDAGKAFGGSIHWESHEGNGAGSLTLPDDFMRLLTFQMSDWSRPVTDAITEDHPAYAMQSSRYGGIRGNAQRPVVAITHSHDTGLALEFYSCESGRGVHIKRARYLAVPKIVSGKIDLCPQLYRSVVYRLASMTAAIIGGSDLAASLLGTSNEMAGVITV